MNRPVSDWMIQTCWWISGIFATGAIWYFLAAKNYPFLVVSGVLALAFFFLAIALHWKNDKIAELSVPTEFKDELPDDYIRRSLDDAADVRLFESLPELKAIAYQIARPGWDTGITAEMRNSTYIVVDFYEIIWLILAEFYPLKHFGKSGAAAYIKAYIRERYQFHGSKHEPNGLGTGGITVLVLTGGSVMDDLDRLIIDTALSVTDYMDNLDWTAWRARWERVDQLHSDQSINRVET